MQHKNKIVIGLLTASLAFFGVVKEKEGYTEKPIIPTRGDVPTIGHGTTVYPDGTHVRMSDSPINKQIADRYLHDHVSKTERQFKATIPSVQLSQAEYDVYLDFVYQYGVNTFKQSSMRTHLLNGEHMKACESLLKYKYVAKRDCSIRSNNCYGVWIRQKERYNKCIAENKT